MNIITSITSPFNSFAKDILPSFFPLLNKKVLTIALVAFSAFSALAAVAYLIYRACSFKATPLKLPKKEKKNVLDLPVVLTQEIASYFTWKEYGKFFSLNKELARFSSKTIADSDPSLKIYKHLFAQIFSQKIWNVEYSTMIKINRLTTRIGTELKHFHIRMNLEDFFEKETLYLLAEKNPNIEHLSLDACELCNSDLIFIAENFKSLKSLSIKNSSVSSHVLLHLKYLSQLESLDLEGCKHVHDDGLDHLKDIITLKSLNLANCKEITNKGIAHLKDLILLESLDISGCYKVTCDGLAPLKTLVKLQILNLARCSGIYKLEFLKDFMSLKSLDLSSFEASGTDTQLIHLKSLINLRSLNLSCCTFSNVGLAHLKGFTSLEYLDLSFCDKITDFGIARLSGLSALQTLILTHSKVTDKGLSYLKNLIHLKTLDLEGCEGVSVDGIAQLKHLSLQMVYLSSEGFIEDNRYLLEDTFPKTTFSFTMTCL